MEVDEPAGTSMEASVDEAGAAGGSQTQQVYCNDYNLRNYCSSLKILIFKMIILFFGENRIMLEDYCDLLIFCSQYLASTGGSPRWRATSKTMTRIRMVLIWSIFFF